MNEAKFKVGDKVQESYLVFDHAHPRTGEAVNNSYSNNFKRYLYEVKIDDEDETEYFFESHLEVAE